MEVYPTMTDLTALSDDVRDVLDRLAKALRTDTEMLLAIADGHMDADGIMGTHPTGTNAAILGTLADWIDGVRDVADKSENGYEARRRRQMAEQARAGRERRNHEKGRATPERPCVLYRLLDETGRVLYIGVTRNPKARLKAHRRKWGDLIASAAMTEYSDARSMLAAEAEAIRTENPPLNIQGVDGDDADE